MMHVLEQKKLDERTFCPITSRKIKKKGGKGGNGGGTACVGGRKGEMHLSQQQKRKISSLKARIGFTAKEKDGTPPFVFE